MIPAGIVPDCCGENEAEPESKILVLPVKCTFQQSPVYMMFGWEPKKMRLQVCGAVQSVRMSGKLKSFGLLKSVTDFSNTLVSPDQHVFRVTLETGLMDYMNMCDNVLILCS